MNTPNTGIPYVPEGTLDPAAGLNLALNVIDALLQTAVIDMDQTAPPGAPVDGDLHIVASPATGAWAGQENNLARYVAEGAFWQFFVAGVQVHLIVNRDDLGLYRFDSASSPGAWSLAAGLGDAPADGEIYARRNSLWEALLGVTVSDEESPPTIEPDVTEIVFAGFVLSVLTGGVVRIELAPVDVSFQIAVSDMTTDLTVGVGKAYFRAPHAFTLTGVRSSLFDASSSGLVTVDINENGASVISTKLSIDATEKTSLTAAAPAVISDAAIADDAEITIDIDAAGTDAKGLVVTLLGTRP